MRLIVATVPIEQASSLGRTVVEERLAACANIVPSVHSIYRWEGAVEEADEAMVFFKTTDEAQERLTARIRSLHSYDVPEIISFSINESEGNPDYLAWIRESTD